MSARGSYQKTVANYSSWLIKQTGSNSEKYNTGRISMTSRQFHLRLNASYQGSDNTLEDLTVEVLNEGEWQAVDLGIRSGGFFLFINGLFSCQHLYMRTNSAECNLQLSSSKGELYVETDENWEIIQAQVSFVARLKSGEATDDALEYIIERMHHCPVSTNLPESVLLQVSVTYE
jgi:hypothetical protein